MNINSSKKRAHIWFLACAISLLTAFISHSQQPFFETISHQEGLYQNTVYDITQDEIGYLWMGTPKGLIRYDGINFTVIEECVVHETVEPLKRIYALLPDYSGNLWVGGSAGIYKYSLQKEVLSKVEDTNIRFSEGSKFILAPDSTIILVVPTGLYRITDSNQITKIGFESNEHGIYETNISKLIHVKDSIFLYCLEKNECGLCSYNSKSKSLSLLNHYTGLKGITSICKEDGSIYWLGLQNGIKRIKLSDKGDVEELDFSSYKGYSLIEDYYINKIYKATNGQIYAATSGNGLVQINTDKKEIYTFRYNEYKSSISWDYIKCIFEDNTGIIWLGTGQRGLTKLDIHRKPFYQLKHDRNLKNSLSHDHVNSLYLDSRGHLWVGTTNGGLNVSKEKIYSKSFEELTFEVIPLETEPSMPNSFCVFEFGNDLLIAYSSELFIYNLNSGKVEALPETSRIYELLNGNIISLNTDYNNRLWIGCTKSLHCINIHNSLRNLLEGNFEAIPVTVEGEIPNFPFRVVRQIYCSNDSSIYIASNNGLFVAEKSSNHKKIELKLYQHQNNSKFSISQNEVNTIFEDSHGRIWVGTFNGGLNLIEKDNEDEISGFRNRFNGINLPENTIFRIEEDRSENLWISTYSGLYKYNPAGNDYINYTKDDGLPTNLYHQLCSEKSEDGMLIFGSILGLTGFYPEQITSNTIPPKVSITSLKIFNKELAIGEKIFGKVILPRSISQLPKIKLPKKCNVVTLGFSAFHYSAPKKNLLYYRLIGFDSDWVKTTVERNFANYTNLAPGSYTFQVMSINQDKTEKSEIAELDIEILPPWYQTIIAYILFALFGLGLIYLIVSYFRDMANLKHDLEIEKIEKSKEQEITEAKLQFFTNISHELKTPLSLITGPVEKLRKESELSDKAVKLLNVIHKNSSRLNRLINQIMDFRKLEKDKIGLSLEKGDITSLVREVISSFEEEINMSQVHLKMEYPDHPVNIYFDQDKIEKVVYNVLSNALRHTPKGGKLGIKIFADSLEESIVLQFKNQGIGVPVSEKEAIFERFYRIDDKDTGTGIGLAMAKSFIEFHHGIIVEKGVHGQNALFEIKLPVNLGNDLPDYVIERTDIIKVDDSKASQDTHPKTQLENDSNASSILIVEDNLEMLEFLCDIFSGDYSVLKAQNGLVGYELAEQHIPELIITDIMMPVMEGDELCKLIKKNPKTSHIPLIMLTAKDNKEQQIEGLKTGADAYLSKPFDIDHLTAQVNNLLESRKLIQESFREKYSLGISNVKITPIDEQLMKRFILFIEENISNPMLKVEEAAKELSYSYVQFNRKIKAITGESVGQFLIHYRLNRAKQVIEADQTISISEVMFSVGFNSSSYFSKCFRERYGVTPKQMQSKTVKGEQV